MGKQAPPKGARFLIWITSRGEDKEDKLVAFDERFDETVEEFGLRYAQFYAWQQALRSMPFGMISMGVRAVGWIIKLGS